MNNFFITAKKWSLLFLLAAVFCGFYYFDLHHYLNFNTLKNYQSSAQQWTLTHHKSASSLFILIFTLLIACTIPCATILTLLGGFLFGGVAVFYSVFATTLGGTILCLAVRTALGSWIEDKSTGWIKRMEKGFQKNAFNYLLILRLIPVFPCWISNVSAGVLNIPIKTFVTATIIGVFPSTLIYTMVGRGLDKFLSTDQVPTFNMIFTPSVFFPLLGLACLSISPLIYKKFKSK